MFDIDYWISVAVRCDIDRIEGEKSEVISNQPDVSECLIDSNNGKNLYNKIYHSHCTHINDFKLKIYFDNDIMRAHNQKINRRETHEFFVRDYISCLY